MLIPMILNTGCSIDNNKTTKIAYISANIDSEYEQTFEDLHLGTLFDFNLKLPNADTSWVDIWIEGYKNGKPIEPVPLTQLSYGLSPNKINEGSIGFGIINPNKDETQLFLYSVASGAYTNPYSVNNDLFTKSGFTSWNYAIGNETIGLEAGKEIILAVYRQNEDSIRTGYNYQDINSVNEMIKKDTTVLLLKIKVDEKNEL